MSTPTPSGGLPKLRPGQLRGQVAAILAAAGTPLTVAEVADRLGGRSGGAVGNALQRLVDTGHATLVGTAPRRYQAGGATATLPPVPPKEEGDPPRPGAVRRPNGSWYLPRKLAGGTDIDVLRRLRGDNIPVLLYGPPGTGKTSAWSRPPSAT